MREGTVHRKGFLKRFLVGLTGVFLVVSGRKRVSNPVNRKEGKVKASFDTQADPRAVARREV